jgi:hypothetical protein
MDVLNSLVAKASEQGLLQPLLNRRNRQRLPLYAGDIVLFMQPRVEDVEMRKNLTLIRVGSCINMRKRTRHTGKTAPEHYIKEKTFSHRSRKTPNCDQDLSPCEKRQRPGPGLRLVLWCGIDEGIFLTTASNSLPREVERGTRGVQLRPPNH